jgi:hypothetical protein
MLIETKEKTMKLNDATKNVEINNINEKLYKLFHGLSEIQENIQLCSSNTPDSVKLPLGYKVNSNLKQSVTELRELRNMLKELSDLI